MSKQLRPLQRDYKPTENSMVLCDEISKRSGGVCFLAFSRGKDSLCAWLQLRNHFKRIIPFHLSSVPHLKFVDKSLAYYEKFFQTKIERCMSGTIAHIADHTYQSIRDFDLIDKMDLWDYEADDVADKLREKYNLHNAYCAHGIAIADGWTRAARLNRLGMNGAIFEKELCFYPCYDWDLDLIMGYIESQGCELPPDYLFNNRSLTGLPIAKDICGKFIELFPEDYAKMKEMYPLIGAVVARNEFRKLRQLKHE